jgi:hypothetical protein
MSKFIIRSYNDNTQAFKAEFDSLKNASIFLCNICDFNEDKMLEYYIDEIKE